MLKLLGIQSHGSFSSVVLTRSCVVTSAAVACGRTSFHPIDVVLGVGMARLAEFFRCVIGGNSRKAAVRHRALHILASRNGLKVIQPHAPLFSAKVVELQSDWDWSVDGIPKPTMGRPIFVGKTEHSVIATHRSRPNPAISAGIDLIEEPLKPCLTATHAVIVADRSSSNVSFLAPRSHGGPTPRR